MEEITQQMQELLALERIAVRCVNYQPFIIPGILQTAAYRHSLCVSQLATEEETAARMQSLVTRRSTVFRSGGPELEFILDESILRRKFGSEEIMHAQLREVAQATRAHGFILRVVPFDALSNPDFQDPCYHLVLPGDRNVLFREHSRDPFTGVARASVTYDADSSGPWQAIFSRLRAAALTPEASLQLIGKLIPGE